MARGAAPLAALFLLLGSATTATAQDNTAKPGFPITTDRPSFSDGTLIVPRGRVNIETGYTYFEAAGTRTQTLPELIVRLPLSDRLELRLVNLTFADVSGGTSANGLLDPQIGFKLKLANGTPRRSPDLALVALTTLPIGARAFRVTDSQPTVKLATYFQSTDRDGFGANLNVSFLGEDRKFSQFAASIYWSRTLTARAGAFLEGYRLMPVAVGQHDADFVDAGLTYLLNPATQVDFRLGSGLNRGRDGAFVGAGISFRF